MKKIFIAIIMLLAMTVQTQAATYYKIKVAGVEVNSDNASRITHKDRIKPYKSDANNGEYSISYSGNENGGTLTLRNVRIERDGKDNRAILNDGNPNLTIIFEGENYLKAADSSPVRLNGKTLVKCKEADGSNLTQIIGGSEDAFTVGNGATVTIQNAHLHLESNSSVFDSAGDLPTLIIKDSEVYGNNKVTKTGDSYGLRDYKQLTVENSRFYLSVYAQATVVSNLQGFTKGAGMKVYGWNATGEPSFDSSKKTFVNSKGNIVTLQLDMRMGLPIDENNFPDSNFRAYVKRSKDRDGDGYLDTEEIEEAEEIFLNYENISTLQGIEHFIYLKQLYCSNNSLVSLDLSKNTELTQLYCEANALKTLNVSNCKKLTYLDCRSNELTSLNVTNNTELTKLYCHLNSLSSLNIQNNTKLEVLDCAQNKLATLNVSKNTALKQLLCKENGLNSLDVSKNTELTNLDCSTNNLQAIDVSNNKKLTYLSCLSNHFKTLNVANNTELTVLLCHFNGLSSLNVQNNTKLTDLCCAGNNIETLDVSKNTALTSLLCYGNKLSKLDVSKNTNLGNLACDNNMLTSLTVSASNNRALNIITMYKNKIQGTQMENFVNSLPTVSEGSLYVVHEKEADDGNLITAAQAKTCRKKGWEVFMILRDGTIFVYYGKSIMGDVNGDGKVNVGDIMAVINIMAAGGNDMAGDVNGDKKVNVGDIMAIINIMAEQK